MTDRKKIIIDIDECICDNGFIFLVNKFLGTNYKSSDFKTYYIDDVLGSEENKQKFYKLLLESNVYEEGCVIFEGAREVIEKLNEKYDVYICSNCVNFALPEQSGLFFKQKYDFMVKNFPFLDPYKFIFTGSKGLVCADIMIDDKLSNFSEFAKIKLLFTAYHNSDIAESELEKKNVKRVNSWSEVEKILL